MVMKGGVGAGGSGGDEAGDGKQATLREPSCRRRERRRRRAAQIGPLRPPRALRQQHRAHGALRLRGSGLGRGGDQRMADIGGSTPVNTGGGASSYGLTRASSPSRTPPRRLRKMARYFARASKRPPPWAMGAAASRYSFQTSTPPPTMSTTVTNRFQISNAAANKTPAYNSFVASVASSLGAGSSASASAWMLPPLAPRRSSCGASVAVRGRGRSRGATLMNPLGFLFCRSGGEQAAIREEEVMNEKNADEEQGLEPTLGNAETRKDRA